MIRSIQWLSLYIQYKCQDILYSDSPATICRLDHCSPSIHIVSREIIHLLPSQLDNTALQPDQNIQSTYNLLYQYEFVYVTIRQDFPGFSYLVMIEYCLPFKATWMNKLEKEREKVHCQFHRKNIFIFFSKVYSIFSIKLLLLFHLFLRMFKK